MPTIKCSLFKHRSRLGLVSLFVLSACAPKQRDMSELVQSQAGSRSEGGNNGVTSGGTPSTNVGGNTTASGGTSLAAGTSGLNVGGSIAAGASALTGGAPSAGATNTGGTVATGGVGGLANRGGAGGTVATGGSASLGGVANNGGASPGGASNTGGVRNTGGASNTGGIAALGGSAGAPPTCIPSGAENCSDGVDNDCNGTIDCPLVVGRYPEPGLAVAGDDAWVQLQAPVRPLRQVECRSGKPALVQSKAWLPCSPANLTALKIHSMSSMEAFAEANNGVTQFEFRFAYQSGAVSDPRSLAYYAHNSLADTNPGTPTLACPPTQPDSRYFDAARPYIAPSATSSTFTNTDVQLKSPFIFVRFAPKFVGDFVAATTQPEIRVLSLRHRFALDANRQMILVTRSYKSSRAGGGCQAGVILNHDSYFSTAHYKLYSKAPCDAIVLNRAGAGVCLANFSGTIKLVDPSSGKIITFLQTLGIAWPSSDPMMWQKLFDTRAGRDTLQYFSPKCLATDAACRLRHPGVPLIPAEGSDAYFTNP